MKVLRGVFAFYINSSIHVALAVLAFLAITVMEYNLTIPIELWAFVFLGALTGYNFVKYAKVAGLHHRRLTNSLKTIQVFSALCFVLLGIIAFQLSITTLLAAAGFGLTTFFYAVPFIKSKNLRRLSGVKIFVVAFVWAGVTVIVPVVASEVCFSGDLMLTFLQRVLIVIALILPFEIRDVPYDAQNLNTVPHKVGVKATKLIGEGVLLLCLVFEFFKEDYQVSYIISLLSFCVVLGWLIVVSKTQQSRYFASFWVEGLPIFWLALFILFENL
ncbi:hypothetical protein [Aequorivita sp. CIP111184]|uniref:hypothetical protein n=1 Tax=Aequorivita sp. CIP111184 TaxID=2211356 RepID=UPI000DBBC533|nr:hypothetical protein [Aequorivita sp. CIP111184]SRX54281.1 hypothetical protein AEQU1_01290 [Aequorivita sp. CIP111184]